MFEQFGSEFQNNPQMELNQNVLIKKLIRLEFVSNVHIPNNLNI
jgi:hypothetical protein